MKTISLSGNSREITKKSAVKALRREGMIPCVLYGEGVENLHFTLDERDLAKIIETPNSYIIELSVDGKSYKAIFHAVQYHPLTDRALHVDFLAVSENKPVVINVPIKIVGSSAGVREGGKLIISSRKIRIAALLEKLPDYIKVDVTKLKVGQTIYAGELKLEEGVELVTAKGAVVCAVRMTRAAIGAAAAAAAAGEEEGEATSEEESTQSAE